MQPLAAMRSLVILLAMVATARADDGFEWDPPPPPNWELRLTSVLQGKPDLAPYGGLSLAFDHRLDGRVWAGLSIAAMGARELSMGMEPLPPLQSAFLGAATARVQLGEAEEEDVYWAWEARAELGTAIVTRERVRSTPAIGSVGLTGRIGGRRTRALLSLGFAFAVGGSGTNIDPGGIDVRLGVARAW